MDKKYLIGFMILFIMILGVFVLVRNRMGEQGSAQLEDQVKWEAVSNQKEVKPMSRPTLPTLPARTSTPACSRSAPASAA